MLAYTTAVRRVHDNTMIRSIRVSLVALLSARVACLSSPVDVSSTTRREAPYHLSLLAEPPTLAAPIVPAPTHGGGHNDVPRYQPHMNVFFSSCCACAPCGSPVSSSQQRTYRPEPRGASLLVSSPGIRFLCLCGFTCDGVPLQENGPTGERAPCGHNFSGRFGHSRDGFSWVVRARAGWRALAELRHQVGQTKQVSGHGEGCPRGGSGGYRFG